MLWVGSFRGEGGLRSKRGICDTPTQFGDFKWFCQQVDALGGTSGREAARRCDARLQGLRECGNHDRRHEAAAPHPEGAVQTRTSGRPSRAAPAVWNAVLGLKSAW
jgi:hypothetical protein